MQLRILGLVLAWFGATGCKPSVDNCPYFPDSDCCRTNEQCMDEYGAEYPVCNRAERDIGGVCGECNPRTGAGCVAGLRCFEARDGLTQCLDPSACYENTPWPTVTDCR